MVDTTKLGLPILAASQAQKHVTMNESLYRLDTLVQLSVLDKDLTAPPGSPTEGDSYIVGASATGAWSDHDGKVAAFTTGIWFFHIPKAGWLSWVADESKHYSHDGTDWTEFVSGGGGSGEPGSFTTLNTTGLINSVITDNNGDASFTGHKIDFNVSGSQVLTADRIHIGLHIDTDTSASGGNTTDEHRVYGVYSDILGGSIGDSDLVYSMYGYARTMLSAGTITALKGVYGQANADNTGGVVTNAYGGDFLANADGVGGDVGSLYGSNSKANVTSQFTETVTAAYGANAEVEINGAAIGNATAVRGFIDTNGGTISNGYLFRGFYAGDLPGNAWGLYIDTDVPSRLFGGLGIGGASPDSVNRLSVNTEAALFNNNGDDIRLTLNKASVSDDATLTFQDAFSTKAQMGLSGNDDFNIKVGSSFTTAVNIDEATGKVVMPQTPSLTQFTEQVGGAFLLDPNEHVGWGVRGTVDEAVVNDLGNVGADYLRTAGGLMFPFDVKILRFKAKHYNTDATALAWGWRIGYHTYTPGSNTVVTTNLLQEVADNAGAGPRDYLSTVTQETDIDMTANGWVIPAGAVITLGVEAPTAIATNYHVSIMAGFISFERVNN